MLGQFYQPIYLFVVLCLSLNVYFRYKGVSGNTTITYKTTTFSVILVLLCILFIGTRPDWFGFTDSRNYIHSYNLMEGEPFSFNINAENLLFDNIFQYYASDSLGWRSFFLFISTIYFGTAFLGIRKLFPDNTLPAYLIFLAAFSTFSYATNGIKAGAAASLFIWAMGYQKNLLICVPLILLSWGFHHSMQLPVFAFIITLLFKKSKYYYYGWIVCFLMAIAHVGVFAEFFAAYTDERGAVYLLNTGQNMYDFGGKGGFRLDFVIYSAIPVVIGYIVEIKKKAKVSTVYRQLIHLYVLVNSVWMLCMYGTFTNRVAYLSWFLYPIVLIYPILNENCFKNRYRLFSNVMIFHLLFTVFMVMVYYGGFLELIE